MKRVNQLMGQLEIKEVARTAKPVINQASVEKLLERDSELRKQFLDVAQRISQLSDGDRQDVSLLISVVTGMYMKDLLKHVGTDPESFLLCFTEFRRFLSI